MIRQRHFFSDECCVSPWESYFQIMSFANGRTFCLFRWRQNLLPLERPFGSRRQQKSVHFDSFWWILARNEAFVDVHRKKVEVAAERVEKKSSVVTRIERASTLECLYNWTSTIPTFFWTPFGPLISRVKIKGGIIRCSSHWSISFDFFEILIYIHWENLKLPCFILSDHSFIGRRYRVSH